VRPDDRKALGADPGADAFQELLAARRLGRSADAGYADVVAAAVSPTDIAAAAQLACLLEASAPKPGNVSPGRHFADLRYEDFLASAAAIGTPFGGVADRPLGLTIRLAVESTSRWTGTNTNLGIVLLLAPLARAAAIDDPGNRGLQTLTKRVLEATTLDDAREAYAAIRLAAPGGLGRAPSQDVATEPTQSLLEVMCLAADRDQVAREYATGFATTFERGAPTLAAARRDGLSWDDAIVETFLTLLAAHHDTHIVRRSGPETAARVSGLAQAALRARGGRSARGRDAIDAMDSALRDATHSANPGATADLTAAAIFVVLLQGGWRSENAHWGM
jgi:triphosphoribosyl-dephospho-CoA synthase